VEEFRAASPKGLLRPTLGYSEFRSSKDLLILFTQFLCSVSFLAENILSSCRFNFVVRFLKLFECSAQRIYDCEILFHELYFRGLVLINDGITTFILKPDFVKCNCSR